MKDTPTLDFCSVNTTMKVDHVLILAAGKGTRMGKIGKQLPKVLWPVFEKKLIELQVEYAKHLAPRAEIYANVYYNKEVVSRAMKSLDCKIVSEEEVLDIGGGIHNLASRLNYSGNLLILNGDQFLCFDHTYFAKGLKLLENYDSVLYSYKVNSNSLYNSLDTTEITFKGVIPNKELPRSFDHQTYTGMSLIKLDKLDRRAGTSKFFESVANPNMNKVGVLPVNEVEYWDFGTLDRYCESISKLCDQADSLFRDFLITTNAINLDKVSKSNYNSKNGINFSGEFIEDCCGSLILAETDLTTIPEHCVVYRDVAVANPKK